MAAKIDTGMPKGAMRKMLNFSKDEPVGCAVGIGDNKAVGLMVLHKIKRGTAMKKMLEEGFPKATSVRFGTAFVNPEDNPTLVRLQLNRAAPGIAKKLILTLKGTGFKKVMIVSDDGVTEEHEEEDDEPLAADEEGDAAPAAAEPAAAAPPPPPPPGADGVPPAPPPPPAGESPEVQAAQKAALTKALAALMAGIPKAAGDDAARKAVLMKLATDANVALKTGNLKYAGAFVAQLKKEIEAGAPGGAAAGAEPGKLEKLRIDWRGVQQDVTADVDRLADALASTYAGTAIADEVVTRFRTKVAPMLARFDDRVGAALDQVTAAQDAEARAASTTAAKAVVKDYLGFAMTDPLITDLDANPFVPLTIRSKATKVLGAVAQAIA